jgi:uncharacterized DUF497 family protein
MIFSWDESKRQENLEVRKVDLLEAALIFEDPEVIESVDPRNDYGEQRIQALGQVDGKAIFARRDQADEGEGPDEDDTGGRTRN